MIIDGTKRKIITCAMQIIADEGRKGLTTRNLIKKAGISKGSLYHHFSSMDDVLVMMIDVVFHQSVEEIMNQQFNSVEDFFYKIGHGAIKSVQAQIDLGRGGFSMMEDFMYNEKLREKMIEINHEWVAMFCDKLRELCDECISEEKIHNAVTLVMTFIAGIKSYLFLMPENGGFIEMWDELTKMLTNYLK